MQKYWAALLLFWGAPSGALADDFDLDAVLQKDGTRLVVLDFYASWCEPCKESAKIWAELQRRYRDQGLRLVVVTRKEGEACSSLPWTPDERPICDDENLTIAARYGAADRLPTAHIYTWQGERIGSWVGIDNLALEAQQVVENYLRNLPVVEVRVEPLAVGANIHPAGLRDAIRQELRLRGKIKLAETEADLARISSLLAHQSSNPAEACSSALADSLLRVEVRRPSPQGPMELWGGFYDGKSECKAFSVAWDPQTPKSSIQRAVAAFLDKFRRRARAPERTASQGKVEVVTVKEPADDGSRIKNPPRDEKGYLWVQSDPPGAQVEINGRSKGFTPYQEELMVGEYVVVCRPTSNLYALASQRVTVTPTTQRLTMTLAPTFGNLRVESEPPGADILLGGEPTGKKTPHTFRQKPGGRYPVTVSRPWYKRADKTVVLGDGRETLVRVTLEPDFGILQVTSNPQGAEILVNGEPTGEKTPHTFPARKSGDYEVTVALPPRYLPQTQRPRLADGKVTRVDMALIDTSGTLIVTSEPPGLEVLLDGRATGKTPITLSQVPAGVHELKLNAPTYAAPPQRVTVVRGEQATTHFLPQPRLGRLNLTAVVVDGDHREPAEAEVWIDGERQPSPTPFKKDLLVGRYQLKLQAADAEPQEQPIQIVEGEEARLQVALKKLPPIERERSAWVEKRQAELLARALRAAEQRQKTVEAATRQTVSNWLLGIGIGTAVAGGGTYIISRTAGINAVHDATTPEQLNDAIDSGRAMGIYGVTAVGVGVALVVTSLLTSPAK